MRIASGNNALVSVSFEQLNHLQSFAVAVIQIFKLFHNLCKIIFKYYIASSATTTVAGVAAAAATSTKPSTKTEEQHKQRKVSAQCAHSNSVCALVCVCGCFECICVFYFRSASAKKMKKVVRGVGYTRLLNYATLESLI